MAEPISTATLLTLAGIGALGQAGGAGISAAADVREKRRDRKQKAKEFQQSFEEDSRQFDEGMSLRRKQEARAGQESAIQMLASLDKMGSRYGHLGLLQSLGA